MGSIQVGQQNVYRAQCVFKTHYHVYSVWPPRECLGKDNRVRNPGTPDPKADGPSQATGSHGRWPMPRGTPDPIADGPSRAAESHGRWPIPRGTPDPMADGSFPAAGSQSSGEGLAVDVEIQCAEG